MTNTCTVQHDAVPALREAETQMEFIISFLDGPLAGTDDRFAEGPGRPQVGDLVDIDGFRYELAAFRVRAMVERGTFEVWAVRHCG